MTRTIRRPSGWGCDEDLAATALDRADRPVHVLGLAAGHRQDPQAATGHAGRREESDPRGLAGPARDADRLESQEGRVTVRELIEQLQVLNPEADVMLGAPDAGALFID